MNLMYTLMKLLLCLGGWIFASLASSLDTGLLRFLTFS